MAHVPRNAFASLLLLLAGCHEPETPEVQLLSKVYEIETINFLSNTCGTNEFPIGSISLMNDHGTPQTLTFPDLTFLNTSVPTPSAKVTDGQFHLIFTVSSEVTTIYNDATGQNDPCIVTGTMDLQSSVVDDVTWSIDEGKVRFEPTSGPAAACGEFFRSWYSIPSYDDAVGCERTFTAILK